MATAPKSDAPNMLNASPCLSAGKALAAQEKLPAQRCVVCGDIEAYGQGVNEITGVSIGKDAGRVEFKPGTRIKASGKDAGRITGLEIGRGEKEVNDG